MNGCEVLKCPNWNGKMCIHAGDVCIQRPPLEDRNFVRFSEYSEKQKELAAALAKIAKLAKENAASQARVSDLNRLITNGNRRALVFCDRIAELEKQVENLHAHIRGLESEARS
jgi:hypothetical protein